MGGVGRRARVSRAGASDAARAEPAGVCPRAILEFVPPHCPHEACPAYVPGAVSSFRFQRRGVRRIARDPGWRRMFRCGHCGRFFGSTAFTLDYQARYAHLMPPIYHGLMNGQAMRQVARSLGVSLSVIVRAQRLMAGQCLLHHKRMLEPLRGELLEPLVLDGFRTFADSQYEPLDLNTIIGAESSLWFDLEAAPLRRSGTMTAQQRHIRDQRERRLGRPERGIRQKITRRGLRRVHALAPVGSELELRSDKEPDYARALVQLGPSVRFRHITVSSRQRRDSSNPLWRVNHLHRLMRHSLKSHVRETLGFHRSLRGLMDRALMARCWYNLTKGVSERTPERARITPAMRAGLASEPVTPEALFAVRLFPRPGELTEDELVLFDGRIKARPNEHRARRTAKIRV